MVKLFAFFSLYELQINGKKILDNMRLEKVFNLVAVLTPNRSLGQRVYEKFINQIIIFLFLI